MTEKEKAQEILRRLREGEKVSPEDIEGAAALGAMEITKIADDIGTTVQAMMNVAAAILPKPLDQMLPLLRHVALLGQIGEIAESAIVKTIEDGEVTEVESGAAILKSVAQYAAALCVFHEMCDEGRKVRFGEDGSDSFGG